MTYRLQLPIPFNVLLVAFLLLSSSPALAQTPHMPGWMSLVPLDFDRRTGFTCAQRALQVAGLTNLRTQDGWSVSAENEHLLARFQSVAIGRGAMASLNVAGARGRSREAARVRDFLLGYMLRGRDDSGGEPSDPISDGQRARRLRQKQTNR